MLPHFKNELTLDIAYNFKKKIWYLLVWIFEKINSLCSTVLTETFRVYNVAIFSKDN